MRNLEMQKQDTKNAYSGSKMNRHLLSNETLSREALRFVFMVSNICIRTRRTKLNDMKFNITECYSLV